MFALPLHQFQEHLMLLTLEGLSTGKPPQHDTSRNQFAPRPQEAPHPVIVTIMDNSDYSRILLYSYHYYKVAGPRSLDLASESQVLALQDSDPGLPGSERPEPRAPGIVQT